MKTTGPIPFSSYMRQCLTNPQYGYYINKDPLGSQGDFTTSPEISQLFGEMVGIWIINEISLQKISNFKIVEFGPGRGTLMDDVIRTINQFKSIGGKIDEIVMIEASPTLRESQRKKLCGEHVFESNEDGSFVSISKWGNEVRWLETDKDFSAYDKDVDTATFFIAHEFFDALPIRKFSKTEEGWREMVVDYSPGQKDSKYKTFHLTVQPQATPASEVIPMSADRYRDLETGSKIEICPEAWDFIRMISQSIERKDKGGALIIDYGPADSIPEESVRAISKHKFVDPFEAPGKADLSADVDFQAIAEAAKESANVSVLGPVEQRSWLFQMGIVQRATQLVETLNSKESNEIAAARIIDGFYRITGDGPKEMGKSYKFVGIIPRKETEIKRERERESAGFK